MTNKDIKQIKCETDEDEIKQTQELVETLVNSLEGESFLYVYTAASIRFDEIVKLAGVPIENIEKIEKTLSTASYFRNNQMVYTGQKVDVETIRKQMLKIIEIADTIAQKCNGYCDNVIIMSLSILKNYLVDMEMLSKENVKTLNKLAKEMEENIAKVMAMVNETEGK